MLQKLGNFFRENAKGAAIAGGLLAALPFASAAQADMYHNDATNITSYEDLTEHARKLSRGGMVSILVQSENEGIRASARGGAQALINHVKKKGGNINIGVVDAKNLIEGQPDTLTFYINGLTGSTTQIENFNDPQKLAESVVATTIRVIKNYNEAKEKLEQETEQAKINGEVKPISLTPEG